MSDEKEFADAGSRIRALRGAATQGEFAQRLGVNRKTIERWEAGERLPDGQSLLALMTVCGADVNYILTGQRAGGMSQSMSMGPQLRPDQAALLDNYEHSDEVARQAAQRLLDPRAQRKKA